MSCCDIVFCIIKTADYASVGYPSLFYGFVGNFPTKLCVARAFIEQFSAIAGISWNIILGIILFCRLYFETTLQFIALYTKYYHIFVWCIALITSSIPLIFKGYGYVNDADADGHNYECWINKSMLQLFSFELISGFCLFFAILLLLYCIYLRYIIKKQMKTLTIRIIYFTIVFVIVWLPPFIDRIYGIVNNTNAGSTFNDTSSVSKVLAYLHNMSISSIGFLNALVWGTSDLWEKYYELVEINSKNKHKIINNNNDNPDTDNNTNNKGSGYSNYNSRNDGSDVIVDHNFVGNPGNNHNVSTQRLSFTGNSYAELCDDNTLNS